MLDILFNPKKAKKHPLEFLLIGLFYSSLSILISLIIFPEHASLIIIFFTSLSCVYIIQGAIKIEEKKELDITSEKKILNRHSKILKAILWLFIGFVLSFAFWSSVLPVEKTTLIFNIQEKVIANLQSEIITGNAISNSTELKIIITNNLKVFATSFILSFFYGAGAIFVLVWNASIMGFAIGSITKSLQNIFSFPVLSVKYLLHGIPEMLSYIIAVLAGSILFISFWNKDLFKQGTKKRIITDISILILISLTLILVSAVIEVFISSAI